MCLSSKLRLYDLKPALHKPDERGADDGRVLRRGPRLSSLFTYNFTSDVYNIIADLDKVYIFGLAHSRFNQCYVVRILALDFSSKTPNARPKSSLSLKKLFRSKHETTIF